MTVRRITIFRVQDGAGAEFLAGFAPIVQRVRNDPGNEQYELFVSYDQPETILVAERWRDTKSMEASLARHYPGRDHPSVAFLRLLVGEPKMENYEV